MQNILTELITNNNNNGSNDIRISAKQACCFARIFRNGETFGSKPIVGKTI